MLHVSPDRRYLVNSDNSPFTYLGDTAWELLHRTTREEADLYLDTRARQRFTVIQTVVLAEQDGLNVPNSYGHLPLIDQDPTQPNEAYFEHVDYVIDGTATRGMHVGLLPTWGDKVNLTHGKGPVIFTPANAGIYGEYLRRRYRDRPIIWILGGDRSVDTPEQLEIWRAMAAGVRRGDGGGHLITFHPKGRDSSSMYVHDEPWLDFNMMQSGHNTRHNHNWEMIAHDYALLPTKPTLDGEPAYEDHPIMKANEWVPSGEWFDPIDIRRRAYWALLAGAFGHTYGCHPIWQHWQPGRPVVSRVRHHWKDALEFPAANQMRHVRTFMESRPMLKRVPDQSMVVSEIGTEGNHIQAARANDGSYAFVYSPSGKPVTVDLSKLASDRIIASWFDTRTGEEQVFDTGLSRAQRVFTPPAGGEDWVLVLDAKA